MIKPRMLTNTFFTLFIILFLSCNSKPKKETEVIKDEVELIPEESVEEEIDSVSEKVIVIPVAPTLFDLAQKTTNFSRLYSANTKIKKFVL